jgi:predicted RNA-binding protein with TRAM domain
MIRITKDGKDVTASYISKAKPKSGSKFFKPSVGYVYQVDIKGNKGRCYINNFPVIVQDSEAGKGIKIRIMRVEQNCAFAIRVPEDAKTKVRILPQNYYPKPFTPNFLRSTCGDLEPENPWSQAEKQRNLTGTTPW